MRKITEDELLAELFFMDKFMILAPYLRLKTDDLKKAVKTHRAMQHYILYRLKTNKNKSNPNMPEIDEIGDLFKNFDSKTKPF
jgi:hypothetical protein